MAIEDQNQKIEENNNQTIPEFNPESFLEDDNDISINGPVLYNQEKHQQENEQEEEQEEEIDDFSIENDFLENTVENEEKEFNPEDYAILSKTLGIDIKTKEDLEDIQSKIKGDVKGPELKENSYNFNDEEQQSFNTFDKALNSAKNATNEELMSWHLKQLKPEKYNNNPEELEYHIDNLKEMEILDEQAQSVRENILSEISKKREEIISNSKERIQNESLEINRELESEIKKHKEGFHGINMDAKSLKNVFDKVRNGSIFEEIEQSQANVAEFALLWENRNLFYKAFENPDTSVGVRKVMDELQNSKAKPAAGVKTLKNPYVFNPEAFLASQEISVKGSQG